MTTELVTAPEAHGTPIDGEALVAALNATPGKLPERAIRACQRHRELVTPLLIRELERGTEIVRGGGELERDSCWLALYLLWEFQAREALPAILAAISLPGEGPFDLFGDGITEDLYRVLATLAGDRLEVIDSLIANPELNEYVRSAAAEVLPLLVRDGKLARADAVERLRGHLRRAIDLGDQALVEHLVTTLCDIWPHEARAEIEEAFEKKLVSPMWVDIDSVRGDLAAGEAVALERLAEGPAAANPDTVEEIRGWNWPGDEPDQRRHPLRNWSDDPLWGFDNGLEDEAGGHQLSSGTIVRDAPRVGRNDPCPCGSGKKYKKCCLRQQMGE
jgi:hypothetical protein